MTARKKASKKRGRKVERQHPIMLQVMVDQALLDAVNEARHQIPGLVLTRASMVRCLLHEALRARGIEPC